MSNKHHGPGPRGAMEKPKNFKGAFTENYVMMELKIDMEKIHHKKS